VEHRHKARELAFKALFSWELNKYTTFTDITNIEGDLLHKLVDSAFGEELFLGVLEKQQEIDKILNDGLEHWQIERINKVDLSVLRLSIYSLYYNKDIPPVVTIDEAINLSKDFGTDKSYRFVNGILDKIAANIGVKELK
jgi:transcription antitermination protein NusB